LSFDRVTAMLIVRDLKETIAYYTKLFGFEVVALYPETGDPFYCHLRSGGASLMFTYDEPHEHDDGEMHVHEPAFAGALYFYPTDVSALYERVKDRVDVLMPLCITDYGMNEFRVTDPNGFELAFGGEPD
jgi:uncharacterized glyoxalase superfamily protein PhnB